jgi:hypothetical protein
MIITLNERGAGDGHDLAAVASAAEIRDNEKLADAYRDFADSLNANGYTQECDNLRRFLASIASFAAPIQRHETADGTDNDNN